MGHDFAVILYLHLPFIAIHPYTLVIHQDMLHLSISVVIHQHSNPSI